MSHERDFNRFLETNGLSLNDLVGISEGDFDPSVTGQAAPSGSVFIRHDQPGIWQKTGVADTAWQNISNGAGGPIPLSAVLNTGNETNGSDIIITSGDQITDLVANGLIYPTVDGTSGQILTTDGAGNLIFSSNTGKSFLACAKAKISADFSFPLVVDTITNSLSFEDVDWASLNNGDPVVLTTLSSNDPDGIYVLSGGNIEINKNGVYSLNYSTLIFRDDSVSQGTRNNAFMRIQESTDNGLTWQNVDGTEDAEYTRANNADVTATIPGSIKNGGLKCSNFLYTVSGLSASQKRLLRVVGFRSGVASQSVVAQDFSFSFNIFKIDNLAINVVDFNNLNIATQAEAEAGVDNTKGMTPLRVNQAIAALQDYKEGIANDKDLDLGTGDLISSGAIIAGLTYPLSDGNPSDVITTDGAGNLSLTTLGIDDLSDVDTSTDIPVSGDFLRYINGQWVPSSSPSLTGIPASNNLVYAYDTTIQPLAAINIFQIVTFDSIPVEEGWTYSAGNFTAQLGGAFMGTFEFNVEKNGGGNVECAVKVNKNGTEIAGSHNGMDITSNNTAFSISRTLLFTAMPGDIINFLFAANSTTARILPAPTPGGINTAVGATLLIRRVI
jgi:hypothetical protein